MSDFDWRADLDSAADFLADYQEPPYLGEYPEAGVALAITNGVEPKLLVTQRPSHMNIHAGECAFPGGKWEAGDDSMLATAVREMEEEVGIPRELFSPLGELRQRRSRSKIRVHSFVGLIPEGLPLVLNPAEVAHAFYVPLAHLMNFDNYEFKMVMHEGREKPFLAIHFEDFRIWGLTAAITADLMNTVFNASLPLDETRR
jgi:8-oxo-dGTP pyrophosphatase MutT (NUDIX family)